MVVGIFVVLIVVLAIPAGLLTAVLALVVRRTRIASVAPRATLAVIGTVFPALMLVDGLYLSWPWPWSQPDAVRDGLGDRWVLMSCLPLWVVCLWVSRLFART